MILQRYNMKNAALFLLFAFLVFFASANPKVKEKNPVAQTPGSQWMEGKHGLMVHWISPFFDTTKQNKTPLPEKGDYKNDSNDAVNGFDVDRFGKNLDGWWFDSCYPNHPIFDNKYMKWEALYDAAREGSPDAMFESYFIDY